MLYEVPGALEDEALAHLETVEKGEPITRSHRDVAGAIRNTRFYVAAADKLYGDVIR